MLKDKFVKISCEINQSLSSKMIDALKNCGILSYNIQSGRSVVYREKNVLFGISTKLILEEDPLEIYSFYIPVEMESKVVSSIIRDTDLTTPGHGTIWTEDVTIVSVINTTKIDTDILEKVSVPIVDLPSDLMCISTIVQRGLSESVVKSVLDMGFCVPSVIYGNGTGFRDKLGLLRITVPAEKEVVRIIVSKTDADDAMNTLIDAGKLDQPGKGFIYMYPIKSGLVNTKIFRGKSLHAASIEQIIAAIDTIQGTTEWRKRDSLTLSNKTKNRKFLSNLVDLTLVSNEGTADDLVKVAMSKGAAGATVSKEKFYSTDETMSKMVSPAREKSDFIIGKTHEEAIAEVISSEKLFKKDGIGVIELKDVLRACTYLGG